MHTKEPDEEVTRLFAAALEEFFRTGKVTTIRCDRCGGVIDIHSLGDSTSAWEVSCPCGRFNGPAREI